MAIERWVCSGIRSKLDGFGEFLTVYRESDSKGIIIVGYSAKEHAESHRDQRLVAAAPELYMALQRALEFIEDSEGLTDTGILECGEIARKAIRKAGKQW